jgi:SAM-dependent methyltransferase
MTLFALGPSRTELSPGKILRCRSCRFGFRQLRPSDEQLAQLYEQLDTKVYDLETKGRSRSATRQLKLVERYAKNRGRLLDVGCTSGLFLKRAMDAGWEVEGVEPCNAHCQKARALLGSHVRIHQTTLQGAQLRTSSFDVVTLWDVLEHVPNPIGFLSLAGSLLKPRGFMFANVPNLDSIQGCLLGAKWPLLLPEHLNYFNRQSLRMCGMKAGLQWLGSFRRLANFSLGYIFFRLQQHRIPGVSLSYRCIRALEINDLILPIPLGEICGVWRHA